MNRRDELLLLYVRGYWLTRYLEETRPALVKALLAERLSREELEETVAAAYGKDRERFWRELDRELATYLK